MTDTIEKVRGLMAGAQDVDLPEELRRSEAPGVDDDRGDGRGDVDMDTGGWDGIDVPPAPPASPDDAPPPEKICADFPLNDCGNGQRFNVHFGSDVIFVPRVGWYCWTGTHWQKDEDEIALRRKAQQMTALIARETWYLGVSEKQQDIILQGEAAEAVVEELIGIPKAKRTPEEALKLKEAQEAVGRADEAKDSHKTSIGRRLTHAKNAGNTNAIKNMLIEAGVDRAVALDKMDAQPLIFNTEAGALQFTVAEPEGEGGPKYASVALIGHDRDQLLSKIMPVFYDADADCPRFKAFIERVQPIPEVRRFIQRWLGLSMTALTGEQKFAFFYGSGANGKSVLLDLLAKLMGHYAASAKIESLTGTNRRGGGDATPDLMQLIGARFVRSSEPDEGMRLQEALIKDLTGGETMLVRALHTNFVEFRPDFKLTINANHKPEIRGGDDGIWRRVLLVPFEVQIPPEERDPKLGEKLWEERAGILNWLITGLLSYLENGLQIPEVVSSATQEYREESDPFGSFLTLCCNVTGDPNDSILARDLTEAFNWWLDENGKGCFKPRTVSMKLAAKAGRWRSPATGKMFTARKASVQFYDGIAFAEPFGTRFRELYRDSQGRILRNAQGHGSAQGDDI